MIRIRNLRLGPDEEESRLRCLAAARLRLPEARIRALRILKKSLDARKKNDIHYIYTVAVRVDGREEEILARARGAEADLWDAPVYEIPQLGCAERPVVVGFGPAGMFAALVLAKAGTKPIVLERGQDALTRRAAVEAFRRGGALDPENNVQFGEGGAGTFSDGKLNTGTHDRRMAWVLEQFHAHGAQESILYDAKPHIGTDVLVEVVQNFRREIVALGGEVRFGAKLAGLQLENGALRGVEIETAAGRERLDCRELILAIGHSARDTFEMLYAAGVPMEPKPFSMGVRIEHRQDRIDRAQYGRARESLPPADYSLNVHLPDGSSAYTFCMCPGGEVFAAASEQGGVVTNGMSYSRRDGENANAALLVTLHPEDFPDGGTLAGMYWQREIERRAFQYGGANYCAPAQTVGDFLCRRPSTGPASVRPSYRPGVRWGELHEVLPERITAVLEQAIPALGRKLHGFDAPEAVLTAPETRSSSPVRLPRDGACRSAIEGLYPCGEGAGYAGGISSAAVDGMRCAEAILNRLSGQAPDSVL